METSLVRFTHVLLRQRDVCYMLVLSELVLATL